MFTQYLRLQNSIFSECGISLYPEFFIFPLSRAISVYTIAAVANNTTPTTAIPTDIKIIFVETYPVVENRCNTFLRKNAATPNSAIPGNP